MQTGLIYSALKEGEVDVGGVFATDGRIAALDFSVLDDNKTFFPNYALTPVVRKETLEQYPELEDHLDELGSRLDDETMRALNKRVDAEKKTVETVATEFLKSPGQLLTS
jgi:osmoprotectant transport system substrate-binding protein